MTKIETRTSIAENGGNETDKTLVAADAEVAGAGVDTGTGPPVRTRKPLSFYLAFVGVNIGIFVFCLDSTTLAVAIPAIARDLDATTLQAFWASIAYSLCVAVTQPLYTSLSDVFGRKPPYYLAFLLFAVGSLLFALAQDITTLIVSRVLQGLGGAGLDVIGEILVSDMTTLQERSLYLGIVALPIAIGSTLGPSLGALFSSKVSWRWIGWINLPLLGVAFPLLFFCLRLRPIDTPFRLNIKRLDWGGVGLSVAGITVFAIPLSWAGSLYPWASWQTILPLLVGVALLVAFAVYEGFPATPIVPYRLFRSRTATMTLLGGFMHGAVLFVLLQYLPLFYQCVELQTVIESAVSLLPTSILSIFFAAVVPIAVGFLGTGYCWSLRGFWALMTLGAGLLALLDTDSPRSMSIGIPVIWGAGVGALLRIVQLPIQASVPCVDDTGLAIGLLMTCRCLGGLVGLALSSTIFSSVFASSIAAIAELPASMTILRNPNAAVSFIPVLRTLGLSREALEPVLQAYLAALRAIFYAMTAFGGLGLVTAVFTEELVLDKHERGRQHFEG
ncbi:major facilitator superfamily domain-containing protein [Podospora appendiculata]|uniref:Major facilitator superfamily domain-containing protein n=1 Tax=Podospora appendiculata TaxID=314037 RepID=A0AAE1CFX5_9PEZI|nr:major facilitator superfamily domain-containing protein [Podospora appendiculata]